jgi:hypothetical protein
MVKLTPENVGDPPRPKFGGPAGVLAESKTVVAAFGKGRGFILMIMALMPSLTVGFATIFVAIKGFSRFLG